MDPDANLREQLQMAESIAASQDEDVTGEESRLAELILSLHGWIGGGGFMPQVWREAQGDCPHCPGLLAALRSAERCLAIYDKEGANNAELWVVRQAIRNYLHDKEEK